jgi:hypothetical protein
MRHGAKAGTEPYEHEKPGPVIGKPGLKFSEARKAIDTEEGSDGVRENDYWFKEDLTE